MVSFLQFLGGMTAIIPILVAIVGLVTYCLAANPKAAEVGRILFFCGAFVVCLVFSGQGISWP